MNALEECHRRLARLLGSDAEPIEVLRRAEEHRAYWRPERVRVVLLAESHVHTSASELERRVVLPGMPGNDLPRAFVRLVYCLGYGENDLLDRPIIEPKNSGTPQYWKVFYSCVNRVETNADFAPVLKQTPFAQRIENKTSLLRQLKEAGVWLIDASLAALYPQKPAPMIVNECLHTSWDTYVGNLIRDADPAHILCVGCGVARALNDRLLHLGVPLSVVPQPNARLASTEHLETFHQCYQVVRRNWIFPRRVDTLLSPFDLTPLL